MNIEQRIDIFGQTDTGSVLSHNEDTIYVDHAQGLAVLADGMGGHSSGEIASSMTVTAITEYLVSISGNLPPGLIDADSGYRNETVILRDAVTFANRQVNLASGDNLEYSGMGTTVVAVLFYSGCFSVAHVGDSRFYRLRNNQLTQLTRDHSMLQELIDQGACTPEQAGELPNRNIITRAIGIGPEVDVTLQEGHVDDGDIYLACSDGVTDMLDDELIRDTILMNGDSLDRAVTELIRKSNLAGGKDNISVILARPSGRV
jgi:serine/threonine protein phosphatase PrpC